MHLERDVFTKLNSAVPSVSPTTCLFVSGKKESVLLLSQMVGVMLYAACVAVNLLKHFFFSALIYLNGIHLAEISSHSLLPLFCSDSASFSFSEMRF